MTKKEILAIYEEDPQRLIDEEIELDFGSAGRAKMVDGVAAGEPFEGFKFVSGPYAGKTAYCGYIGSGCWEYETDVLSDGFRFNFRDDEESQGDHIPELHDQLLTLK